MRYSIDVGEKNNDSNRKEIILGSNYLYSDELVRA